MMKRHPVLCVILILIVVALLLGITAGDLWQYLIDFCKWGVALFINWISEMIQAIKDSLVSVIG